MSTSDRTLVRMRIPGGMTALLPIGSTKGTPIKEPQTVSHKGSLNMLQIFAYWTDCAVATYSWAALKKGTPKSERQRLFNIAKEMLADLKQFNASTLEPTSDKDKAECARIEERLARSIAEFPADAGQASPPRQVSPEGNLR